jgi:hypothetical protein
LTISVIASIITNYVGIRAFKPVYKMYTIAYNLYTVWKSYKTTFAKVWIGARPEPNFADTSFTHKFGSGRGSVLLRPLICIQEPGFEGLNSHL